MYIVKQGRLKRLSQTQVIVIGFAVLILLGTILLMLPIATRNRGLSPIDALFTATSATCVTGLVVVDTYSGFTFFGQFVIMMLVQIGGLGFMTIATLFSLMLRRTITLNQHLLVKESINNVDMDNIATLARRMVLAAMGIEFVGAALLAIRFVPLFGWRNGVWKAVFHSITAYCNAGFDLMGEVMPYSSLTTFVRDPLINFVIMALIILGGLGFVVCVDVVRTRSWRKLKLHTKLALTTTAALLLFGFVMFFILEYDNPATIGDMSLPNKLLASAFQSVTPRTAGFNTIDYVAASEKTKFITILLMFIGGSPGSTAGGIKTVTLCVLILSLISVSNGRVEVAVFKRRISSNAVMRAFAITMIALLIVILVTVLLLFACPAPFLNIAFEVVSAFGTVGLSAGVTGILNSYGKIIMIALMFLGRVGVLTMTLAFTESMNTVYHQRIKYPEEKIMVG